MSDRKVNIENLQKQYELHKEECEKQEREHLHSQIRRWRDEIGNSADVMLQTSAEAILGATESDAQIQKVAIEIISYYWKMSATVEVLELLKRLLNSNVAAQVREVAIYSASLGLRHTRNALWMRILAEIAMNAKEPDLIRQSAIVALYMIAGIPFPFSYGEEAIS